MRLGGGAGRGRVPATQTLSVGARAPTCCVWRTVWTGPTTLSPDTPTWRRYTDTSQVIPQSIWINMHLKFGHLSVMIFTDKRPKLPSLNIILCYAKYRCHL